VSWLALLAWWDRRPDWLSWTFWREAYRTASRLERIVFVWFPLIWDAVVLFYLWLLIHA